jgi:hypothetical protein
MGKNSFIPTSKKLHEPKKKGKRLSILGRSKQSGSGASKKSSGIITKVMAVIIGGGGTLLSLPLAAEHFPSQGNKDAVEESFEYMISQKENTCPSVGAETLSETYTTRIRDIANSTYEDQYADWTRIKERYTSGMDRLTSVFTGQDSHSTELKETAILVDSLARLGVSICFDEALDSADLGSTYTPNAGLITLNPHMIKETLTIHLRRHVENLRGELAEPHSVMTEAFANGQGFGHYEEVRSMLNSILDGDIVGLTKVGDPNIDNFVVVERATYEPVLQTTKTVSTESPQ